MQGAVTEDAVRVTARVRGAVQGVGLRPWVHREAVAAGLAGSVRNTAGGVEIDVEGPRAAIEGLFEALRALPAPARVDAIETVEGAARGAQGFRVDASHSGRAADFPLLPDMATCDACMAEVLEPNDRRHRHPFASCTRCGPRYTVATDLPWDRERTSMAVFEPCDACRREHDDPGDARRFHAQTLACPQCGPRLSLLDLDGRVRARADEALLRGAALLRAGGILAVLGLGGYQLLVDARDDAAVRRLRKRKARPHKPLALVVAGTRAALSLVRLGENERRAFQSPAGPIVLARRRGDARVAPSVAPDVAWLGLMRPTTPLHRLLIDAVGGTLVATSGNRSGEPLCPTDAEALPLLGEVADGFLTHDRTVVRPIDDSVVREIGGRIVTLRCARGLAPLALPRRREGPGSVALGGDLKAAAAVAAGARVLLGPHVGDLGTVRAGRALARDADILAGAMDTEVARVTTDAHPDTHASTIAADLTRARDARRGVVLHHHAHVLAGWAEHGGPLPVLGVAWDGAGFGPDRTTWGGELLRVDAEGILRLAHLRRFPLPGGDAAAREPRRAALGVLYARFDGAAFERDDPTLHAFDTGEREAMSRVLASGRFAPQTSSAGRLFDAVASLLGVRQRCSYEGQAALALESLAEDDPAGRAYAMPCHEGVLDWGPLLDALLADRDSGVPLGVTTMRFHRGLACGIVDAAKAAADASGLRRVVLTGGCFQNALLSTLAAHGLARAGLEPLLHEHVPPNDGGLAVGQLYAVPAPTREAGG